MTVFSLPPSSFPCPPSHQTMHDVMTPSQGGRFPDGYECTTAGNSKGDFGLILRQLIGLISPRILVLAQWHENMVHWCTMGGLRWHNERCCVGCHGRELPVSACLVGRVSLPICLIRYRPAVPGKPFCRPGVTCVCLPSQPGEVNTASMEKTKLLQRV